MPHCPLPRRESDRRSNCAKTFKIIDLGLARFDEMYAADEGADTSLEVGDDARKAPWYLLPVRMCGSAPEAIHQAAWRGKGALLCDLTKWLSQSSSSFSSICSGSCPKIHLHTLQRSSKPILRPTARALVFFDTDI